MTQQCNIIHSGNESYKSRGNASEQSRREASAAMHSNYCSCVISVSLYKSSRESIRTEHPLSLCSVSDTDRRGPTFSCPLPPHFFRQISRKVFHFSEYYNNNHTYNPTLLFSLISFTFFYIYLFIFYCFYYKIYGWNNIWKNWKGKRDSLMS